MPGRLTLAADADALKERYGLREVPAGYRPRYNISPTQSIPVILDKSPNEITYAKWGYMTRFLNHPVINARSEEIEKNSVFSKAFRERRCLIPADGYYEWRETPSGKQPFRIMLREGGIFSIAGVWEEFEGEKYFATITAAPNALVAPIHERMPVILRKEDEGKWLAFADKSLLVSYDPKGMMHYPVDRDVNSSMHDRKEFIIPIGPKTYG